MSTTYNPALPTDKDWVRFLVGDRDVASAVLSDEEINALLNEEANKYLAAARAGEIILTSGQGLVMKKVEDLSLTFEDSADGTYRNYIKSLRERGAALTRKTGGRSHVLRTL